MCSILIMKTTLTRPLLFLAAGLLFTGAPLIANDSDEGDDHQRGGEVDGDEEVQEEISLSPTLNAPSDARGSAEIEATDEDGVSSAKLHIEVEGLLAGIFTVSAVSAADGTTTTLLGTFPVQLESDDGDDSNHNDDSEDNGDRHSAQHLEETDQLENQTQGEIEVGKDDGTAFPAGFNALDIGAILISDANGIVVLQGDFGNVSELTKGRFHAKVRIRPGSAAPSATGDARIASHVRHHVARQKFSLVAENVPADSSLMLNVNGQPAGEVKTTHSGKLIMTKLPRGIIAHRVTSVSVEHPTAGLVLSVSF